MGGAPWGPEYKYMKVWKLPNVWAGDQKQKYDLEWPYYSMKRGKDCVGYHE